MTSLNFCRKCNKLLKIETSGDLIIGKCNCGFTCKIDNFSTTEVNKENNKDVEIITQDVSKGFPNRCKKCGCEECQVTDLGAMWADESNVYLYKCKKCGFVQRQADGTSNN